MDEGRIYAVGVFEGGDFGVIDVEAVGEGEESGLVCVISELIDEGDGELGFDGGGIGVAGGGRLIDFLVRALGAVAAAECDRWEGTLDGGVSGADCTGESVQEGA